MKFNDATELEMLREYSAHTTEVRALVANTNVLISMGDGDRSMKVFDLHSLDMILVLSLDFTPGGVQPCLFSETTSTFVAVGEKDLKNVHVVDIESDLEPRQVAVHRHPVTAVCYNPTYECFVSADSRGFIEYWDIKGNHPKVSFTLKSETDLFSVAKAKTQVARFVLSPDYSTLVAWCADMTMRVLDFSTGKLLQTIRDVAGPDVPLRLVTLDAKHAKRPIWTVPNAVFDTTNILIYPSVVGVQAVNFVDDTQLKILGTQDCVDYTLRFNSVVVVGRYLVHNFSALSFSANNAIIDKQIARTPVVVSSAINSNRLYVFSTSKADERDVTIKPPRRDPEVTLHTTVGDIRVRLFASLVPKTTENFVGLCERKYYNQVTFHRVIKNFMIQTGDPRGDGTGGESLWGEPFADEILPELRHSRPFMVSMANSGPCTNGLQFFITTKPTPWLDNKHTVFGEVVEGQDTVMTIERTKTTKDDKPVTPISIISTTIH